MADLAVWQRTIVDEEGNVIPGAEVEVRREEDGSLATLYADRAGETPLANPLAADMSGFVRFFAQGDAYTITAVGAGSTRTWRFDPTGRLKEFDKVVAEIITDDAGGQSDIRDKLGTVSRTANLSDLADAAEARSNLGTFSTVADVQNSHIPAVLESIRTLGHSEPGVGDADYRRMLATEVDQPGQIVAADGSRWALVGPEITAEACGALADGTDDAEALQVAAAAAVAADATLVLSVGKTYTFSQLVIPAGCKIRAAGAKLRYLGGLPDLEDVSLTLGAGCVFDQLHFSSPGTEANSYAISLDDYVEGGSILLEADSQKGGSGIEVIGDHVRINYIQSRNLDRPVHVNGRDRGGTVGSYIGFLDVENYIRGIRYTHHSGFVLGGHYIRGRSPNIEEGVIQPGQNGILTSGISDFFIGDGRVDDAGEHAYRMGGAVNEGGNFRGAFGNLVAYRPRAAAFKINPEGHTVLVEDVSIASLTGVDCGDADASGKTPDFFRVSNARRVRVGTATCHASSRQSSSLRAVLLNNVDGLSIGHLHVDDVSGPVILIDEDSDGPPGPVKNVCVGSVTGTSQGGTLFGVLSSEEVGDIYIFNMNVTGYTQRLASFRADSNVVGPIHLQATVRGALPTVLNPPTLDTVTLDLTYQGQRYYGPMHRYRVGAGAFQMTGAALNPADAPPTGLFLNGTHLPTGLNNYGVGLEFGRPGTGRRGAAIAGKQTSANDAQQGLAFFIKPNTTSSVDQLAEGMVLDHQGNLSVIGALSKGSGTFCIDHPLDPYNRDLVHGFVEAPEYGLIYRGRVTLQDGSAEVDIDAACGMEPGTFAALTQLADVHALTNRTGFGRLRASEIVDGKFTIEADDPISDDEVAWMVYAARADDFIQTAAPWVDNEGRLVPSQEKPSELLGLRRHGGDVGE